MAGKKDRAKGKATEAAGAGRKKAGQVLGNEQLEVEGALQELTGKAQGILGKAKEKLAKELE